MTILALLLSVTLQAIETYHVVPQPQDVQLQKGQPFVLDGTVQILAAENLQREALFLRDYIKEQTGLELAITSKHNRKIRTIALTVSPSVVASEGYRLVVGKGGVNIFGGSPAGVFYGIQTLRKSLGIANSQVSLELPPVVINDAPRFSWRGMHLDCARHFFSVAFVKKFIDLLAMHNMNTSIGTSPMIRAGESRSQSGPSSSQSVLIVVVRLSAPTLTLTTRHPMVAITPRLKSVRLWPMPQSDTSPSCQRSTCPVICWLLLPAIQNLVARVALIR